MNSTTQSKKNEKRVTEKEKSKKTSPTVAEPSASKKKNENEVETEKQTSQNLEKNNQELLSQIESLKTDKLRLLADLDNQKKNFFKESEALKYATSEKLIKKILPLFDSYERAIQINQIHQDPKIKQFLAGFQMTLAKSQKNFFQEEKLEEIKVVPLQDLYNFNLHEVIDSEENSDYPEGTILQVSQKGYYYQGKVLRRAEVVISKQKN